MPIELSELDDYQGQPTYRIATPGATWYFHRIGGGLASIVDPDGIDWVSYRPSDGARGAFRGIPNMIHPNAGFHPGGAMCESSVDRVLPDHVAINCSTRDGLWRCGWDIGEREARMTLQSRDPARPYWLLYEGTPGGAYDERQAFWEDSAGVRRPCSTRWQGRLPEPRCVWFGDDRCRYGLYLFDDTDRGPDVVDSFWSMESAMTVFGFGRTLDWEHAWRRLAETPCVLRVGVAPVADIRAVASQRPLRPQE